MSRRVWFRGWLRLRHYRRPKLFLLVGYWVLVIGAWHSFAGLAQDAADRVQVPVSPQASPQELLPLPQIHPLPPSLMQWESEAGDYFSDIRTTPVGYLIWSTFPVTVFVEPVPQPVPTTESQSGSVAVSASQSASQRWVAAVMEVIHEWNTYLPLSVTSDPDTADIAIWRSTPPIQARSALPSESEHSVETSRPPLPRVRSAATRYQLWVDRSDARPILAHRFTVQLSPNQTAEYVRAAARHELGHALGIWGHSPVQTDALYFSQVRQPPAISERDINTLKRIYQQPTRLGWAIARSEF